MKSNTSELIKTKYREISTQKGFIFEESNRLRVENNTNLMFNISGGVKYQDHIIQKTEIETKRIASIQKCLRTDCLSKIGRTGRHHICFEMLGHFMLYEKGEKQTKQETISMIYEYLFKSLELDKNRIGVTVHPKDIVGQDVLNSLDITNIIKKEENIFISPYANKSSFRMEFLWQKMKGKPEWIELWNLVFTQFNSKNILEIPSDTIALDSGGSLERLVSAIEDVSNNYDNSLWKGLVKNIQANCKVKNIEDVRKLADITNAFVNLLKEGIQPGNKAENYVVRKLLRSTFDFGDKLGMDENVLLDIYYLHNQDISDKETMKEIVELEKRKYEKAIIIAERKLDKLKLGCGNKTTKEEVRNIQSTYGLSNYRMQKQIKNIMIRDKETDIEL